MTFLPRVRSLRAATVVALLAAALFALLAAVTKPAAHAESVDEWNLASMINSDRAAHGLPPLRVAVSLTSIAHSWAEQMAASQTLAHNPNLESQINAVANQWRTLGENVGYAPSLSAVNEAFMNSAPHRANILDTSYNYVGVGVVVVNGVYWVTEDFVDTPQALALDAPDVSSIVAYWERLGGASGPLGAITSGEYAVPGGRAQNFAYGTVYWSVPTGPHAVLGSILSHYRAMGGSGSALGLPVSDQGSSGVPGARYQLFQRGKILWSPSTGAHSVYGAIQQRFDAMGAEYSALGLPIADEATACNGGRYTLFQRGKILWSPSTGAHSVYGAIVGRYNALGAECGALGLPVGDERDAARPNSRYVQFARGKILWSPSTGAHSVYGAIGARYDSLGAEAGYLGLPTSEEFGVLGGMKRNFQNGWIIWNRATNVAVPG